MDVTTLKHIVNLLYIKTCVVLFIDFWSACGSVMAGVSRFFRE